MPEILMLGPGGPPACTPLAPLSWLMPGQELSIPYLPPNFCCTSSLGKENTACLALCSTGWRRTRVRVRQRKTGTHPSLYQLPTSGPFPWVAAIKKAALRNGSVSLQRSYFPGHSTPASSIQKSPPASALGNKGREGRQAATKILPGVNPHCG